VIVAYDGDYDGVHFCSAGPALAGAAVAGWKKGEITWTISGILNNFDQGQFLNTAREAFAAWDAVIPKTFKEAEVGFAADLLITTGPIDGPGGVLAWSHLPDGSDRQLLQRYDKGDNYVYSAAPPRGKIDLLAVMIHEIGHAIGLEHAAQNSPDIMAPTYKAGLRSLQPGDIARIQRLYGASSPPPPPPVDPKPKAKAIVVLVGLDAAGAEVARFDVRDVPKVVKGKRRKV
jgi:hypothetical protein